MVGPGQVRVRVGAAAVNFPDVLPMANKYQVSVPVPFVPGSEFAGLVDAVGEGVTGLAPGDRVMGTSITGAFAEQAVVPVRSLTHVLAGVANEPEQSRRNEAELLALLAAGRTVPHVGSTFPLAEASAALRHVADGKAIGKVVLEIG